nr:NADH dehydrogenase subunit 6 [Urodexia penicillum]
MIQFILLTLMFIFNFIFMNMKHPLTMGLMLMIQTLLISLMTGLITKTFWFSYILFLIFIGGMLILFIYVISLTSNEMFNFSFKLIIFTFLMSILLMMILLFINNTFFNNKNMEILSINNLNSFIMENSLSINKLYNYPTNLLTILLMNYLLISLIAIVKITKLFKGPLRPMFN